MARKALAAPVLPVLPDLARGDAVGERRGEAHAVAGRLAPQARAGVGPGEGQPGHRLVPFRDEIVDAGPQVGARQVLPADVRAVLIAPGTARGVGVVDIAGGEQFDEPADQGLVLSDGHRSTSLLGQRRHAIGLTGHSIAFSRQALAAVLASLAGQERGGLRCGYPHGQPELADA